MGRFLDALRQGVKAAASPDRFEVADIPVRCPHCHGDRFALGRAQLNTAGLTFIGLDWADKWATTLLCAECGNIQWFAQTPARVD